MKKAAYLMLAVCLIMFISVSFAEKAKEEKNDLKHVTTDKQTKEQLYSSNDLMQFKAGGHIMGFKPDKVFLASFDHALSVEFVGGQKVEPKAVSTKSTGE
jgi:hypothetical protein